MYYSNDTLVNGLRCTVQASYGSNTYRLLFERENASLEEIEAIDWSRPEITGKNLWLPEGYSFVLDRIEYDSNCKTYCVRVHTDKQYWGDVTGYQAEIAVQAATIEEQSAAIRDKEATIEEQKAEIAQLQADSARQLETELGDSYKEGVNNVE